MIYSPYKKVKLSSVGQWLSGGTPSKKKTEYWNGDVPWISAKSLNRFYVSDSEEKVTELGAANGAKTAPAGASLFVVRGMSLKSEFRVGICLRDVTFNQDLKAIIPNETVEPLFLANSLRALDAQILGLVDEAGHGTGRLATDRIANFEIPLPPLPEQKRIAAVLGALDEKIENNRKMNETLEAMAQAIFKSWFVDFDPAIDNALRAGNPIPADLEEKAERRREVIARDDYSKPPYAELFPDHFVDSELGSIPEGWGVRSLSELTSKIGSGSTPRGGSNAYVSEGTCLIRSQNVYDSRFVWEGLVYITDEAADRLRNVTVESTDVLLNITGASFLRTCLVDQATLPARVNQHVAIVRAGKGIPPSFLHQHLLSNRVRDFLRGMDAGASRQAITKGHIESVRLPFPSSEVLQRFADTTDPFFQKKSYGQIWCTALRSCSSLSTGVLIANSDSV